MPDVEKTTLKLDPESFKAKLGTLFADYKLKSEEASNEHSRVSVELGSRRVSTEITDLMGASEPRNEIRLAELEKEGQEIEVTAHKAYDKPHEVFLEMVALTVEMLEIDPLNNDLLIRDIVDKMFGYNPYEDVASINTEVVALILYFWQKVALYAIEKSQKTT